MKGYKRQKRIQWFESLIYQTQKPHASDILANVRLGTLEIDFVVRLENQFGIIEAKSGEGNKKKAAIDQLSTASQREFLGTFSKRLLILKQPLGSDNKKLANAHNIIEVVLPRVLCVVGEMETGEAEAEEVDRYLSIPVIGSDEGYRMMEDFVATVDNPRLRESLIEALRGRKPFRRFKDVLLDYEAEREQWFAFERQRVRETIEEWAEAEGLEIDFTRCLHSVPSGKLAEQ